MLWLFRSHRKYSMEITHNWHSIVGNSETNLDILSKATVNINKLLYLRHFLQIILRWILNFFLPIWLWFHFLLGCIIFSGFVKKIFLSLVLNFLLVCTERSHYLPNFCWSTQPFYFSDLGHSHCSVHTFCLLEFRGSMPPLILVVFVFKIKTHIQTIFS